MKKLAFPLLGFLLLGLGSAPAFADGGLTNLLAAPVASVACVPYDIVDRSSIETCPIGYTGYQYKMLTKTCPSGRVTTSALLSNLCSTPAPAKPAVAVVDCLAGANTTCLTATIPPPCTPGLHWTLIGTLIAHCVTDDWVCPVNSLLGHDAVGNPTSCVAQIVAPPPAPLAVVVVSAPVVVPPVVVPVPVVVIPITCLAGSWFNPAIACGAGFTGSMRDTSTRSCPSGSYGAPVDVESFVYDTSSCVPIVAPVIPITCLAGSWFNPYIACGAGYTGNMRDTSTRSCPSGSYGAPLDVESFAYDTSSCALIVVTVVPPIIVVPVVTCATGTWPNGPVACAAGFTGTMSDTSSRTCPSGIYGAPVDVENFNYNTSGCLPIVAPPPPPVCAAPTVRTVQTGFTCHQEDMGGVLGNGTCLTTWTPNGQTGTWVSAGGYCNFN